MFEQTPWTWIRSLRTKQDPEEIREHLEYLSRRYWPSVYVYLRRSGRSPEQAAEITQAFFADVILARGFFERVSPEVGRVRHVLAKAIKHYNIDCARKQAVPVRNPLSLDDALPTIEQRLSGTAGVEPEQAFDQRWASQTLAETLQRCENYYKQSDRYMQWQAWQRRLLQPCLHGVSKPSLAQVKEELGLSSTQDVANAVFAVNTRFKTMLREVVSETVTDDECVLEQECQYLLSQLRPSDALSSGAPPT